MRIKRLMAKYDEIKSFVFDCIYEYEYKFFKECILPDVISNKNTRFWTKLRKEDYIKVLERLGIYDDVRKYIENHICEFLTEDWLDWFISKGVNLKDMADYVIYEMDNILEDVAFTVWNKKSEEEKEARAIEFFDSYFDLYAYEFDDSEIEYIIDALNKTKEFEELLEKIKSR